MIFLRLCSLHILTFFLLLVQTHSEDGRKSYIVYMGDLPKGVESTESLHITMLRNILGSKFTADVLVHSYKKSLNGFVAKLTEEEAARMTGLDDVVSVFPNKRNEVQTTRSWDFVGLSQSAKRTSKESDIIVGVIDTGIWPESRSFDDQGFGPPPSKWKGTCHNFICNNKIVGAKYFRTKDSYEELSPRDSNGHGTHCASTAAGNSVEFASFLGLASGTARGGVPSARIAVYKVCSSSGYCDDTDILQAFVEAIEDGVDIISISIGPANVEHYNYFNDVYAIGAFYAMKKGILTSTSAGNSGPEYYTTSKNAPWALSVAASTTDRKFLTSVQLGDGRTYQGFSVNIFDYVSYPLIYAGNAPNIIDRYNNSIFRLCQENSLDENLVKGKIVLCDDFQQSSCVRSVSGAAGILFRSLGPNDVVFTYALPPVLLRRIDGARIHSYISRSRNPTVTIFKTYQDPDSIALYTAPFSSRGPNAVNQNILKPDLAAPGVDILAASPPISFDSNVGGDIRIAEYNIMSGTSMACPHATAAAAYIKSFYPDWSPAAIKSALMTTATPMSKKLNHEGEFAYGAGQINPMKALNPGLVYDANEIDYVNFLCGEGYDTKKLRTITKDDSSCTQQPNNGMVLNLNLPSFALSMNTSTPFSSTFHRTVTNVGANTSTYKARLNVPPSSLKLKVEPDVMSFSYVGQKKSFTLVIEGTLNEVTVSCSLIWDDGTFQVRSPIVVFDPQM
ncbi:cucumisin [Vigna angularis]|nr:cucumisin [Vigna angularis]